MTGGFYEGDGAQKNHGLGEDYDAPEEISYAPQIRFKTDRIDVNFRYALSEDTMYYGRISTGFRAGGFNSASGFNPPIEEETLINYELGVKGLYLDRRLNVRAGAFFEAYDNFQHTATTFHPNPNPTMESPLVEFTDNIDGTTIWGLEVESTYYIAEKWRLSGFYAYLGSNLGEFSAIVQGNPNVRFIEWEYLDVETNTMRTNIVREPQNYAGGRLPIQPRHKGAATLSYRTPLEYMGGGTLQLLGTLSYTGERFPFAQNVESQAMAAYRRLDLRAGWTPAEENWNVVLYPGLVWRHFRDILRLRRGWLPRPVSDALGNEETTRRRYGDRVAKQR